MLIASEGTGWFSLRVNTHQIRRVSYGQVLCYFGRFTLCRAAWDVGGAARQQISRSCSAHGQGAARERGRVLCLREYFPSPGGGAFWREGSVTGVAPTQQVGDLSGPSRRRGYGGPN